jgi:hypothetical protein
MSKKEKTMICFELLELHEIHLDELDEHILQLDDFLDLKIFFQIFDEQLDQSELLDLNLIFQIYFDDFEEKALEKHILQERKKKKKVLILRKLMKFQFLI